MNDEKLSLPSRLALAALELRGWQADKRNKDGNYDYISADAVLHRAGQALGSNGVVIVPAIADHGYDVGTTASGKPRYDAWVFFDMTMVCEGGEILTAKWVGRGTDYTSVDKATYKAITSGHKYFLMKLLCIGVGNEDSEHDESEAPSNSKPQAQPKKQAAQAYTAAFLGYAVKELGLNEETIVSRLAAQYPVPTADKTEAKARFDWLKSQVEQGL